MSCHNDDLTQLRLQVKRSSGELDYGWTISKPYFKYGFKGLVMEKEGANKIVHPIELLMHNTQLTANVDFVEMMHAVDYIFPGIPVQIDGDEFFVIGLALYEGCDVSKIGKINGLICYHQ